MTPQTTSSPRSYDLDWLRVLAFCILVPFHAGMMFNTWGFHIKNIETTSLLDHIMIFQGQWRLSLLFLISGAGVFFALRKRTVAEFRRERWKRLGIPLLFGMAFIIPPQIWVERAMKGHTTLGYVEWWLREAFTQGTYSEGSTTGNIVCFTTYSCSALSAKVNSNTIVCACNDVLYKGNGLNINSLDFPFQTRLGIVLMLGAVPLLSRKRSCTSIPFASKSETLILLISRVSLLVFSIMKSKLTAFCPPRFSIKTASGLCLIVIGCCAAVVCASREGTCRQTRAESTREKKCFIKAKKLRFQKTVCCGKQLRRHQRKDSKVASE